MTKSITILGVYERSYISDYIREYHKQILYNRISLDRVLDVFRKQTTFDITMISHIHYLNIVDRPEIVARLPIFDIQKYIRLNSVESKYKSFQVFTIKTFKDKEEFNQHNNQNSMQTSEDVQTICDNLNRIFT